MLELVLLEGGAAVKLLVADPTHQGMRKAAPAAAVDHFIQQRFGQSGLAATLAAAAGKGTLCRRCRCG